MQVIAAFSPATYILEGVRRALIDGVPITEMGGQLLPLAVMAVVFIPLGVYVVRLGRALRQADRQAQESGVKQMFELPTVDYPTDTKDDLPEGFSTAALRRRERHPVRSSTSSIASSSTTDVPFRESLEDVTASVPHIQATSSIQRVT